MSEILELSNQTVMESVKVFKILELWQRDFTFNPPVRTFVVCLYS